MSSEFDFELRPFPRHGFFWCKFRGEITPQRLGQAHRAFLKHPEYKPWIDELLDFSETTVKHLSEADIEIMKNYMMKEPTRHGARSVVVANSEDERSVHSGVGQTMGADVPMERHFCSSIRDAVEWLCPDDTDELLNLMQVV